MSRNYTVRTQINKPVSEVFDAVVSSDILARYFTDASSGDLLAGEKVIWNWAGWGDHPVEVKTVNGNELIELTLNSKEWDKTSSDSYDVLVTFEFEHLENGSTMLSISESGWKTDADGLKGSHDNCGGWQHMALCLKAWLEYEIDLRK